MADALSRLNLLPNKPIPANLDQMAEHFGLDDDDLPADAFPLQYKMIAREQNKDKNLFKLLQARRRSGSGRRSNKRPLTR